MPSHFVGISVYSTKIIQSGLDDLKRITKSDFYLCDSENEMIASTFEKIEIDDATIFAFLKSDADSQNIQNYNFVRIRKKNGEFYVLISYSKNGDGYMISRVAASEIIHLMSIENNQANVGDFYKDLVYGNILLGEIRARSNKLKIKNNQLRRVFSINVPEHLRESSLEIIKNMYSDEKMDYAFLEGTENITLIKTLESDDEECAMECARQIVSMMNTELMIKARVTFGRCVEELGTLSESYKESIMAIEVVMIFYDEKEVASYKSLGIGRLIHQLPKDLCQMFLEEVFGDNSGEKLSEENIHIIDKMFDNNLNVAETSRDLKMNRTTLIYRLDKLKELLGLDIRVFDEAITLKIAMMVAKFVNYKN